MPIADSPGAYDFTIYAGASFSRTFTISPTVNLTGYTGRAMGRDASNASATVFSWGTAEITCNGTASSFTVALSPAATSALGSASANLTSTYVYDLELVSGGGEVTRILAGQLTVSPEVTR